MQESLLEKFNDTWKNLSINGVAKKTIHEGIYNAEIMDIVVTKTKTDKTCLKWKFKIVGGDYSGEKLWKTTVLSSEENIKWLKHELSLCGLEVEELVDLENKCQELDGTMVEIRVKKSGNFNNVYINKKIA